MGNIIALVKQGADGGVSRARLLAEIWGLCPLIQLRPGSDPSLSPTVIGRVKL